MLLKQCRIGIVNADDKHLDQIVEGHTCKLETFGFSVNIAVVTADQLIQAVADAPTWWGNMPDVKHNLIVAIAPKTGAELSAPVKTFGRTRWSTVAKGDLYQWLTIRNANTARKLVALAQALREA